MVVRIHLWIHLVLDFYFWAVFDYQFNFITSNWSSDFLSLPDSVLEDCLFLGFYSFLLGCPVCWHIIFHSILLFSVVFLWCKLILLFSFWIYLFEFFSFFPWWVWLRVINCVYLNREIHSNTGLPQETRESSNKQST